MEHEAYVTLRNELPDYLKAIFVIGFHTGVRVGELEDLEWPQVELNAQRIVLHPGETKNDEGRTIPIFGEMLEWLRMAKEIRDTRFPNCSHVFHRDGELSELR